VQSWQLNGRASAALIEHTANTIAHWQERNATSRVCHTKRTRKKLREIGVKLKDLIRCKWP
jgi:hypothetical protein